MMLVQMVKMVLRNQKGQGMAEYGLILALVAVAAVGAFSALSGNLNGLLEGLNFSAPTP